MLTRLTVKNFRLLREVSIDIEPGKLMVLIGPNSSGKSSVLEVIDILHTAATEGLKEAIRNHSGAGVRTAGSRDAVEIELTLAATNGWPQRPDQGPIRYGFRFVPRGGARVESEWLYLYPQGLEEKPQKILSRNDVDEFWVLNSKNNERDKIEEDDEISSELSFQRIQQKKFYPGLDRVRSALSTMHVYAGFLTTPTWIRAPSEGTAAPYDSAVPAPMPRLDRRGLNLINALYHLQSNHPTEWDELLRAFRSEFPYVTTLHFPSKEEGRISLLWTDKRYPDRLRASLMSEGMIAYLCLLAAIFAPEPTAALAFDEPDAHVHPSATRRLVNLLERAAQSTAVIVATHSDRFLDFLSEPAESIRICEPSGDGTLIKKLDPEALTAWLEKYSVSELRARGHLDSINANTADS